MANKKISDFGTVTTISGDDYFLVGDLANTYKMLYSDLKSTVLSTVVAKHMGISEANKVLVVGADGYVKTGVYDVGLNAIIQKTVTNLVNDSIQDIGPYAFCICPVLSYVNCRACTFIGSWAFFKCSTLTTANFSACTSMDIAAFEGCSVLSNISFPRCKTIGQCAFQACVSLTTVRFPECTTIRRQAFDSCTNLKSIYLGASTVCSLENTDAFEYRSGNANYTLKKLRIYVPSSLYDDYLVANNWSDYSNILLSY